MSFKRLGVLKTKHQGKDYTRCDYISVKEGLAMGRVGMIEGSKYVGRERSKRKSVEKYYTTLLVPEEFCQ